MRSFALKVILPVALIVCICAIWDEIQSYDDRNVAPTPTIHVDGWVQDPGTVARSDSMRRVIGMSAEVAADPTPEQDAFVLGVIRKNGSPGLRYPYARSLEERGLLTVERHGMLVRYTVAP